MLVSFEQLDAQSKIWIYQSERVLDEKEKHFIMVKTEAFLKEWTAHGSSLQAAVEVLYDRFVIIGVNEAFNQASGCSIDKSVAHIRELGNQLNIDLLQRSNVAVKVNDQVNFIPFNEIKSRIEQQEITPDSEVFNHAIAFKGDLESKWILPVRDSWINRYF